jgi:hypothetical protein
MNFARIPFDARLRQAVRKFWQGRDSAATKQRVGGKSDQGNRGMVTGGKTLDSFRDMIVDVIKRTGPKGVVVHRDKSLVVLPGFFRPTKLWDVLVVHRGRLLVAVELKSLCGPSFGNNANNRCEEALGSAYDFRKAQSEGLFGPGAAPFLGYFILVEAAPGSQRPVRSRSPHFATDPCFNAASYQHRMQIMCERMVQQQLYASAAVLTSPNDPRSGDHANLSAHTSFRNLLTRLAAHLASEAETERFSGTVQEAQAPYGEKSALDGDCFTNDES